MTIIEWMDFIGAETIDEVDDYWNWHFFKLYYTPTDIYNRWIYGV